MTRVTPHAVWALTLLLLAACSDTPTTPQLRPSFSNQPSELLKLARYRGPSAITDTYAEATIGPTGGSLSLGGFEVDVPPGALPHPTTLTITLPTDAQLASFVWASFGPEGLQFNVPVTLMVPYSGTTSEDNDGSHVMWFDGAQWVALETTKTLDGRLQTNTKHFSSYGTETPDTVGRGIVVAGGG